MQQDNRPIKIEFPNKLNVQSPEIDSINKSANSISNWLHNDLRKIIEPLTVLHVVPDLVKDLSITIVKQFTTLFLGQVEADVINRQANIKVSKRKIDSTQNHIHQKEENLNTTIERVNDRYSGLSDQLNVEHETFLRKLDSHAYEIVEKIYPEQIQNRFSCESLPSISFLSEHALISVTDRNLCLEQGLDDATKSINSFQDKISQFNNSIYEYKCNDVEKGSYYLPYCFVELENNKTEETKLECWFECEIENNEINPDLNLLREEIIYRTDMNSENTKETSLLLKQMKDSIDKNLNKSEKQRLYSDLNINN
jgi:hypothetical protein